MTTALAPPEAAAESQTTLAVPDDVRLKVDLDDFFALCTANPDLRLERAPDGGVSVMAPAGSDSSGRNARLVARLGMWDETVGNGEIFESSGGFTLPDGSVQAPDAAWILRDRWTSAPEHDRSRFAHVVPDFVAEVRSPSDALTILRAKMEHYVSQGVRLAWLIDPIARTVEIYRPGRDVEILSRPATLSGEDVLPGFTLDLKRILYD